MSTVRAGSAPPAVRSARRRAPALAALLALACFGLYGLTAGNLVGYEDETAAVAQGLVKSGELRVAPHTPLTIQGIAGRGGYRYGRTGLAQPLLEVPFYWVGEQLDGLSSHGHAYRWRLALLRLFDPALAALAAAAIFGLAVLRGVGERRALLVAVLAAVASLIWPYSKIGMETTLMAALAASFLAAAWAAARPSAGRFALCGVAFALAANAKPYGGLVALGVLPLLWEALRASPRERRWRALVALALPVALGIAAVGWYNWYRTGSVTDFLDTFQAAPVAAPISALGLYLSPGKGLLLYSPLAILGLLGWRRMRAADRALAWGVAIALAANTAVVAISIVWSDETWGPRYLVPSAWLALLPIAWWLRGRRRRRWLAGVAALGVWAQLVGVIPAYGVIIPASRAFAGVPVYVYGHRGAHVPYGDDGPRWIPGVSPLLYQSELVLAWLKEQVTGSGFTVSYRPFLGVWATVDLRHVRGLPDFWWTFPGTTPAEGALAAALAVLSAAGGVPVVARLRRRDAYAAVQALTA